MALRLLEIGTGDLVFCSSLTWIASIAPAVYLGAEPVFIDSEPETWNMSPIVNCVRQRFAPCYGSERPISNQGLPAQKPPVILMPFATSD